MWLHGDLHPANMLTADGTFCGVIDFGDLCAGDPALDLAAAWILLPDGPADRFHDTYRPARTPRPCAAPAAGLSCAPSPASSSARPAPRAVPAASRPGAHRPTPPCAASSRRRAARGCPAQLFHSGKSNDTKNNDTKNNDTRGRARCPSSAGAP
ncbi:hypothetical protein GCM10010320_53520 [Streptomyces caelestis]|nr:hypothetical protein GCM10010320_53520 [Streptomyces caelestis]